MDWIMEILLGLLGIATAILTILQINANTRQKEVDTRLSQYANEKQELQNQLATVQANAEVQKSLIETIGKMSGNMEKLGDRLDKNTDAHYINTQLSNEAIDKHGKKVDYLADEQKKSVEKLTTLNKTITQASFDTNSQLERLAVDIRSQITSVTEQLSTMTTLIQDNRNQEHDALKQVTNNFQQVADKFRQTVDSLLPSLNNFVDKHKSETTDADKASLEVVSKETETDKKEDIA